MNEEFEFSGGLKFPLDNKGNISYFFSNELREKCFENDHIVSWSCGLKNQTIISFAILNAYKLKYGDSKRYYSIYNRKYEDVSEFFGQKSSFVDRYSFNIEYPSPIILGDNITYINTSYKYSPTGIVDKATTFKEVWRNSLIPWNNQYKIKLKKASKEILDIINPKWPTLVFLYDDEDRNYKNKTSFYWDFNSLKFFLYTLSVRKMNVIVFSSFSDRLVGIYPNVHSFECNDFGKIFTAVSIADYFISSDISYLYGCPMYSNATIVEQRNHYNVADELRDVGMLNDTVVIDEFTPDSVYSTLFG